MAASLSKLMGWMSDEDSQKTFNFIEQAKLPCKASKTMTSNQFLELMSVDKKVMDGVLRLILMKGIGKSVVTDDYTLNDLRQTIEQSIES